MFGIGKLKKEVEFLVVNARYLGTCLINRITKENELEERLDAQITVNKILFDKVSGLEEIIREMDRDVCDLEWKIALLEDEVLDEVEAEVEAEYYDGITLTDLLSEQEQCFCGCGDCKQDKKEEELEGYRYWNGITFAIEGDKIFLSDDNIVFAPLDRIMNGDYEKKPKAKKETKKKKGKK